MTRILFVCLGNICRSPMAEFMMKALVAEKGAADEFEIASAGTSDEEEGNPVYPPAARVLAARGIDCSRKRAVVVTAADYARYDRIIGMESRHLAAMRRLFGGDPAHKLSRLLDYTDQPRDVADPWYTGDFTAAERDIAAGCAALWEHLR